MKISAINTYPVSHADHLGNPLNYLFVRINTDDGLTGYGEVCDSFGCTNPLSVAGVIDEALAPLLFGEEPLSVERLTFKMRGWTRRRLGDQGVIIQAISGVEIALWDLAGKAQDKSVSQLLGRRQNAIPVYASGTFLDEGSADYHAKFFEPCLAHGVRHVKVRIGLDYGSDLETLRALRALLGDDVQIMVDGNEHYSEATALEIAKELADVGVLFFEEPIPQNHRAAIASLVGKSPVPIAYGEHLFTTDDFEDCLIHKRANVIQPDAAICGGIAEAVKISGLASTYGTRMAPHSAAGPLALAANLHLCAAAPNIWMLEFAFPLEHFWKELLTAPDLSSSALIDGALTVPATPGLGLAFDEDVLARYPYKKRPPVAAMPTWSVGQI